MQSPGLLITISAMPSHLDLNSRSVQDYLKALYKLQQQDAPVSTNVLAERLQVAPASATAMMKKLAEAGLVEHIPYQGCRLTDSGRQQALKMVRRHRIIEQFLQQVLHYGLDEVDEEAEVLEHAVSDKLIERMWQVLGQPSHDPHGSPIPDHQGRFPEQNARSLCSFSPDQPLRIVRLKERSPAQLRYLHQLGIEPGAVVRLVDKAPFNGPITLHTPNGQHPIARELAEAILAEPDTP